MPGLTPVKRVELIARLRRLGFANPHSGGKHQFMTRGDLVLHIPNPHHGDIGADLLMHFLRQAKRSPETWLSA